MNGTTLKIDNRNLAGKAGYYLSLFGAAIILLWIGIFKFTPTEANAIKPLVENHFLTFFVYDIVSIQAVSNAIGVIEIIIALKITEQLTESIKRLLKLEVVVQRIKGDNVLPFGLLITDNDFLLTTLDKVAEAPEYTAGLWLENGKPSQLMGYIHLFKHFVSSECDLAVLTPKKKMSQSNVV